VLRSIPLLLSATFACTPTITHAAAAPITIPFEQDKDHRIYVRGTINQSPPLRFLLDTGADGLAVSRANQQRASLTVDDHSENTGADGVSILEYSTHNQVRIGGVQRHMGAVLVDYQNRPFDAVVGWMFFAGKIVEINHDSGMLILHAQLPELVGYSSANVRWIDNTPAVEVIVGEGNAMHSAWLTLDTGSNGTLDFNHDFSAGHQLQQVFTRKVGTSRFTGSAGRVVRTVDVRIPSARVAGLSLGQPRASIAIDEDGASGDGTLGAETLRQFNLLLDTRTGAVYLRPNRLAEEAPSPASP